MGKMLGRTIIRMGSLRSDYQKWSSGRWGSQDEAAKVMKVSGWSRQDGAVRMEQSGWGSQDGAVRMEQSGWSSQDGAVRMGLGCAGFSGKGDAAIGASR